MLADLKADLARYPGSGATRLRMALSCAGFYAVVVYRFGRDVYFRWPRRLRLAGKIVYKVIAFFTEWATGIALSPSAVIGPGLYIGHWGLIQVSPEARLGAHCNLSPMVIIGFGAIDGRTGVPRIGDRCYIAAGAKILGPIEVGSGVAVGANAVVVRDVPDDVSVGGVPAKIISRKGSAAYIEVGQALDVAHGDQARPPKVA
jgi:serine O-acetyltransferase